MLKINAQLQTGNFSTAIRTDKVLNKKKTLVLGYLVQDLNDRHRLCKV